MTAKPSMLANPQLRPSLPRTTSTEAAGKTSRLSALTNNHLLYSTAGHQGTTSALRMDVGSGQGVGMSSPRKRGIAMDIEHVSFVSEENNTFFAHVWVQVVKIVFELSMLQLNDMKKEAVCICYQLYHC